MSVHEEGLAPEEAVPPAASSGDEADETAQAEAAVEADLASLVVERDEMRALAVQLKADFENYRKRMLREQTQAVEQANARLLESLLPVLESFELAQRSIEAPDADVDKLRGGVLAAIRQLTEALDRAGLERVDAIGVEFDPQEHEAVLQEDGDGDPVVSEILRTGYRLKGRVLRPAMVKVARS